VGRILPVLLGLTFAVSACAAPAPRDAGPAWEYVSAPFLVAAAEDASMPCGLARDYKIGARLDPPRRVSENSSDWRFSGCFYSHGLEIRDAVIVVLPEGRPDLFVMPLADHVAPTERETRFSFLRSLVDGDASRARAYLAFHWRTP